MTVKTPAELKMPREHLLYLSNHLHPRWGRNMLLLAPHLRLWAPTARRVEGQLCRKGSGGEPIGTLPLERGQQGV